MLDVLLCIGFMYVEKKRDNVRFWFHRDALKNNFLPSTSEFLNNTIIDPFHQSLCIYLLVTSTLCDIISLHVNKCCLFCLRLQ